MNEFMSKMAVPTANPAEPRRTCRDTINTMHDELNELKMSMACSSAFVEYSVLDSQQTAIMTSRLIIDVLKGKCELTRLVSWIGSAEKLKSEGFQTSDYFYDLEQQGKTSIVRDIPRSKRCLTCGSL